MFYVKTFLGLIKKQKQKQQNNKNKETNIPPQKRKRKPKDPTVQRLKNLVFI